MNRELKTLADEKPELVQFWSEFGVFLKEGVAVDPGSREALVPLLRFRSTHSGDELTSLADYVSRMRPDQDVIYYVLGEDYASVARSPHLDYFRAHDIEVLYLADPVDGYMTAMLHEAEGKRLQNVDDAGLKLPETPPAEEESAAQVESEAFDALAERFKATLGDGWAQLGSGDQPCRLALRTTSTAIWSGCGG